MTTTKIRKIGLITCASNFERHQNIVESIHKALHKMGNCVLYVLTNYGIFLDDQVFDEEKVAIYSLLDTLELDGCIIEGNIGSINLINELAAKLSKRKIPFITMNTSIDNVPWVSVDFKEATWNLLYHFIEECGYQKINVVIAEHKEIVSKIILETYRRFFHEKEIPIDENRIIHQDISMQKGRELYTIFKDRGILDANVTIFVHDVLAIGFCSEMEKNGYHIPEDMNLVSLNHSANSMIFKPSIAGIDRMDDELSSHACDLLFELMSGKNVPMENYFPSKICKGDSCPYGEDINYTRQFQQIVFGKVESGNQISQMMELQNALEEVETLEEFGEKIFHMMKGISCEEFFCCLTPSTIQYLMNTDESMQHENKLESSMVIFSGNSKRGGMVFEQTISMADFLPISIQEDDIYIIQPIGLKNKCYGYMIILNSNVPIYQYNYRICIDSIGICLENLHRQMCLRQNIRILNDLHMRDSLTGLYNRFAIEKFSPQYLDNGDYSIVILDMDDLKSVNDSYGHLAGNNAISIVACTLQANAYDTDIVIRYGGDEFLIMSYETDENYWKEVHERINFTIKEEALLQKLPYPLGVSLGVASSSKKDRKTLKECFDLADKHMYQNKRLRKNLAN